ncbi:MAG TPA: hypothetical protein VGE56_03840 [Rhodocyclaceae bacterium]|jgi:hypothetical protein
MTNTDWVRGNTPRTATPPGITPALVESATDQPSLDKNNLLY